MNKEHFVKHRHKHAVSALKLLNISDLKISDLCSCTVPAFHGCLGCLPSVDSDADRERRVRSQGSFRHPLEQTGVKSLHRRNNNRDWCALKARFEIPSMICPRWLQKSCVVWNNHSWSEKTWCLIYSLYIQYVWQVVSRLMKVCMFTVNEGHGIVDEDFGHRSLSFQKL